MSMNSQGPFSLELELELDLRHPGFISYKRAKRAMDLCGGLLALILLSPILATIAVLVRVVDGGSVLFKQQRTGQNGCSFTIYKFRTMKPANQQVVTPNQAKIEFHNWSNGVPDDFLFKSGENPNITPLGSFLRKTSLDELPQFINIVKGEMSLIGPRPEVPQITEKYNEMQRKRLLVKPGLTGYAQVNGRSLIAHGEKIRHDLYYIRNYSLRLDLWIFLKTVAMVIFRKGAF